MLATARLGAAVSRSREFFAVSVAANQIHVGDRYRHFKGGVYQIVGVGKHTETLEEFVVYQPFDATDELLCIRPLAMFIDSVDRADYHGPRFQLITSH
jgi:hypothetical protein